MQRFESKAFINRTFAGSLPQFLTAFMDDKKISKEEAEKLKKLIDTYRAED